MKILALRVRNLTSLAGEVALDFEAPPLAQAGLFAITGPTGAGKSTLLDALCLALYDELPRLSQGGDVRSVLRHGAAEGHAEVDFMGRDGGRYRARWEVRRARNRRDGTLQKQSLSLSDLSTGAALGGGKRETLRAVEDKVGLDYHQFRRSVLLAQNDFDAFLRAKPDDRASLLELMTGTAIYGDISRAAFARCKAEDATLRALDEDLKRVNVLADDERAAVEGSALEAEDRAVHLSTEVDGLAREIEWYRTAADLTRRLTDAEAAHGDATARWEAAQPQRDHMARVRQALALAPVVAEASRLAAERARLEAEHRLAGEALERCETEAARLEQDRDTARLADEQAEAEIKAAAPALEKAAELDARLVEAEERVQHCQAAAKESALHAEQARNALESLTTQRRDREETLSGLETWLADHQDRQPLAEQTDRWLDIIGTYEQAAKEHDAAAALHTRANQEQEALDTRLREVDDQSAALSARLDEVGHALAEVTKRLERVDVDALELRREGLTALIDALRDLEGLSATAGGLGRRARDIDGRRTDAEARQGRARAALREIDAALTIVRAALPEAQAALALAEAAEGEQALVLRQRLLDGEPCPVCGSRDHPLGNIHGALTALLDTQRCRVAELQGECDGLVARQGEATAEERSATETLAHAGKDADAIAGERLALSARWTTAFAVAVDLAARWDASLAPLPEQAPEVLDLGGDLAACGADRDATAARLQAVRQEDAERRRLGGERDSLQAEATALSQQRAEAVAARTEWVTKQQSAEADAARTRGAMEQAADRLTAPLAAQGDWRAHLRSPRELAAQVSSLAAEWRDRRDRAQTAREDVRALATQCDAAATALATAQQAAARDRAAATREQEKRDALATDRAALFDGRPTAEVRTAFNTARQARQYALRLAQEAWSHAAQERGAAQGRVAALAEAHASTAGKAAAAVAERDRRLDAEGITAAEVEDAVALGKDWLADAEAAQAALRDAATVARTVVEERRGQLAAHAASGQPERKEQELAALLSLRTAERDAARDEVARVRQRLAEDDRNRGAAEETRRLIADQRKRVDLWKGMADLIGSADGKKFRVFAQGLTLDRLLGLANRHMADLTPRYVLQRAPGIDLDLQVIDRDMADDVRPVANLSGGERFLVSLSLALGLASMTGGRTLAESLFIDEGFGALDAESLDVAIGALETLHAAGRKVGVISHVQPMIDRIGVQVRVTKQGGGRSAVETKVA